MAIDGSGAYSMTAIPKIKTYRSPRYLTFIRTKRSLKSGLPGMPSDPIVAAHQSFGMGGWGMKGPDIFAVPLLWSEHQQWEHQKGNNTFWGDEDLKMRCLEYIHEYMSLSKGKKI